MTPSGPFRTIDIRTDELGQLAATRRRMALPPKVQTRAVTLTSTYAPVRVAERKTVRWTKRRDSPASKKSCGCVHPADVAERIVAPQSRCPVS